MRVRLLSSAVDDHTERQYATTFLIDEVLAVDAGSLGYHGSPEDQARVRNVVITHSHADHLASLPIFIENSYVPGPDCPTVWGNAQVLRCIREDLFNDRLWPDFLALSKPDDIYLRLEELANEVPVDLGDHRITPVLVSHQVQTFGFVIESKNASVVIVSDTGPTERIWEVINGLKNLQAVFVEAAFPDEQQRLATTSQHLTPSSLAEELAKIQRETRLIVVHMKPRYRDVIAAQLGNLAIPGLEIGAPGEEYALP